MRASADQGVDTRHSEAIINTHKQQNYHHQRRGASNSRPILPRSSKYMVADARRKVYD